MDYRFICIGGFSVLCAHAAAYLRLSPIFGDNMVLQVGHRTPVFGVAAPRQIVDVKIAGQSAKAEADQSGNWRVELDLPRPGGPFDLEVDCAGDRKVFHNVLLGEVWLCSGQSNMEWSYHSAKLDHQVADIGNAKRPNLRLFKVMHAVSGVPLREAQGKWLICTPDHMNDFSLLGYLFGAGLQDRLGCGVGIIESDWGGTPAESWTPRSTLTQSDDLRPLLDSPVTAPTGAGAENKGKPKPERAPCVLFNGMIHPVLPFGFRGVAWYQGESNVGRSAQYRLLFPAMIAAWRQIAGRDFPFLFVQLADFGAPASPTATSLWAALREAQTSALALPMTGMVTAVDLAHPKDIHSIKRDELAKRLTWLAMSKVYSRDKLAAAGPVFRVMTIAGDRATVEFDNKLNGLVIRGADGLSGFEIAGEDRVFHKAYARIHDGAVIVWSPKVAKPVAVRYAWADDPAVSLYNSAGLPALPFRTDDWDSSN